MELENLIRQNVLFSKESATGFNMTKGACCHDYQARAGFNFSDGNVGYNCFNCGAKYFYAEDGGHLSKKFKQLLLDFDIDEDQINRATAHSFLNKTLVEDKVITMMTIKKLNLSTPQVDLPAGAILLSTAPQSESKTKLIQYLEQRKMDINSYPWYFVPDSFKEDNFKNRIIIPYFRGKVVIYWQARAIDKLAKRRYLNCETPKAAVIFGYDELYSWSSQPLFITEGAFDAISLHGVCLLGSVLSEEALTILRKTKRRVIFVIDPDANGKKLGNQVIENGWELAFAPSNSTDVNNSIIKNGKLFTVYYLMNNTFSGFTAKTKLNLLCKRKSK